MVSDTWLKTTEITREETCCYHIMVYTFHRQNSTYHDHCYISGGALAGMKNRCGKIDATKMYSSFFIITDNKHKVNKENQL